MTVSTYTPPIAQQRARIAQPYLVFLGNVESREAAKTAFGLRDWLSNELVGQWRSPGCTVDLGLPDLTPAQAVDRGARSMVLGVAPVGGAIPEGWTDALIEALEAGLDLVSGLHTRLTSLPATRSAAERFGRRLHDVRHTDRSFPVASGRKRRGRRLLTVGTDCALGKKYTALAIHRALQKAGVASDFRATGQTGIMIAGDGVAIDAVVADFIAGAAETLSPDASDGHWDVIEGQGSLFHPSYAGVTLGLVHGSQPDAMVLCHDPLRTRIWSQKSFAIPDLATAIRRYEEAARLTNPAASVIGISLDTSRLDAADAEAVIADTENRHGLLCFDPLRSDLGPLIEQIAALSGGYSATGASANLHNDVRSR